MKKITKIFLNLEKRISEILLIFIIIFVFIAAVLRWFRISLIWSIDLAQLLFIWVSFLGADIALQNNRHIGIDVLTRNLPKKVNKIILIVTYLLIIFFLTIIVIYGIQLAIGNYKRQFQSMEFSFSWATSAVPVGSLLMIRTLLKKLCFVIKDKRDEEVETINDITVS